MLSEHFPFCLTNRYSSGLRGLDVIDIVDINGGQCVAVDAHSGRVAGATSESIRVQMTVGEENTWTSLLPTSLAFRAASRDIRQ